MDEQIENDGIVEENKAVTKVERKRQRREKKQQLRANEAQKQRTKRVVVWGLVASGLAGIIFLAVNLSEEQSGSTGAVVEGVQIRADDWIKGNPTAKVVLVEYGDFQCPACATFSKVVEKLSSDYGDRVAFVYRHFPLKKIHRNAEIAAYAAEAAGKQGKFWEMHDILYEGQNDWSESDEAKKLFTDYAGTLNLDLGRFQADSEDKDIQEKIDDSYTEAVELGLTSTPSFILNGKKIEARSYEQFEQLIKQELGEGN
jgi:protein-disulfide isomerase